MIAGEPNTHCILDDDGKKTIDSYKNELELLAKQMEQLIENKSQIDNEIKHLQARLDTMEKTENELKAEKRQLLRKVSSLVHGHV